MQYKLGDVTSLSDLPKKITIENHDYYLIYNKKYYLLDTNCPHKSGKVVWKKREDRFVCPNHGWCFAKDGRGINNKNSHLTKIDVIKEDNLLYAIMEDKRQVEVELPENNYGNLSIQLISHACLFINISGYTILTDPWIGATNTAFLGSWIHFPITNITPQDIKKPNCIVITHEHSDHLNPQTLKELNFKDVPVFIPDFPNQRMQRLLQDIGYKKIFPLQFGNEAVLNTSLDGKKVTSITCYEPVSWWNDALFLFDLDGFKLLNVNDAGVNYKIAKKVKPVHCVASSFSPGASGYPMTWQHLSPTRKQEISKKSAKAELLSLEKLACLYEAKYIIPFASHFSLYHPDHKEYRMRTTKNYMNDVINWFANKEFIVVDLLPGDTWYMSEDNTRFSSVNFEYQLNEDKEVENFAKNNYKELVSQIPNIPKNFDKSEVIEYFSRLDNVPEMQFCELINVNIITDNEEFNISFSIIEHPVKKKKCIRFNSYFFDHNNTDLEIFIPLNIFAHVIRYNISFDEAHIGYWCRFYRKDDIYHHGFFRLLQAPYFLKKNNSLSANSKWSIADIIEKKPQAEKVMKRYGLYCIGCSGSPQETLEEGATYHGLDDDNLDRLIKEINAL